MMKYIIIIILLICLYYCLFTNNEIKNKKNINSNILPFGYQYTDLINTACKKNFYNIINKYGTKKDKKITDKILSIKHKYAPTWGIKIDRNNKIEFEMYFYVYNPLSRQYEKESITVDKLEKKFNFKSLYNPNITMYSIDYHEKKIIPNFYYFTSSDNIADIGYSEKDKKLNNHYYRYFSNTIDNKYEEYIDNKLINYDIKNIKTVFIADKLIRNYYGIYYDGINYSQLNYFIEKYNFDKKIINEFDEKAHYSISVDYDKKTKLAVRIGIYGLLY